METSKITFELLGSTFTALKSQSVEKIDSNGGAAPWMIGRKVKSSKTVIIDYKGNYLFNFGFNFKMFNQGGVYRKNTLSQIEEMIMGL